MNGNRLTRNNTYYSPDKILCTYPVTFNMKFFCHVKIFRSVKFRVKSFPLKMKLHFKI